jgi:hypothetical protein
VTTVLDTFDFKRQVRQRPWSFVLGAAALGFLGGFRSSNCGPRQAVRNGRSANAPVSGVVAAKQPNAEANGGGNGADGAQRSASEAPSWLANLGGTFQPEIAALRGVAVGAILEIAREAITKQVCKAMAQSVDDGNCGAKIKLGD